MSSPTGHPAAEAPSAKLARLQRELAEERALSRVVFEDAVDGIAILFPDGSSQLNRRAEMLLRSEAGPADEPADAWKQTWGFFRFDGTPIPIEELPGVKAMRGVHVKDDEFIVRNPRVEGDITVSMTAAPLPNHASITVIRDVGPRMRMQAELRERGAEIAARDEENRALVERLRAAIDEIATPILRIAEGVLVVPIIGVLDPTRSARTAERVLAEVTRTRARSVIVEVTGAELGDTATAEAFARITRAVALLGARCVVSGMRPSVARTLVELGVRLDRLPTFPSLQHALRASLGSID
jgi:rsbT co-antagonist protein RsbR